MGVSIDLFPIGNTKKDPIKQIVGNVPTNLDTLEEISQNTIAADTISYSTTATGMSLEFETLDGRSPGSVTFPSATTEQAGVMSADDKKNLDNVPSTIESAIAEESKATDEKIATEKTRAETVEQTLANDIANAPNLALRALFVAAGAEYNDSGTDKTKTAPWGETVTHKAGHYYINGLGDITEEEMMYIYNYKDAIKYLPKREGYRNSPVRTYFAPHEISGQKEPQYTHSAFVNNLNLETVIWNTFDKNINTLNASYMYNSQGAHSMFYGCKKLKLIYPMNVKSAATIDISNFNGCSSLVEVRLFNLMLNTGFKDSPDISKQSILYIVNNAAPTSAITITLHADAYARLANDADIVAALEAQPLVTLVSA